jgi:transcriptional regulator with XRE-family HTH domain
VAKRPSQVASERIRSLRKGRGMTQLQLAERLTALGSPIDRVAVAKLENGQRGLPLDEALLFALALDVAPINLFLPLDDEDIQIAPKVVVPLAAARRWVAGTRPLDAQDQRVYYTEVPEKDFLAQRLLAARQLAEDLKRANDAHRESILPHQREGESLDETELRLMEEQVLNLMEEQERGDHS